MYNNRSLSGRSRTTGLATVVALHVGLVGLLITMKPAVSTLFAPPPPLKAVILPDIVTPPQPIDLPAPSDDLSVADWEPQDTMQIPEFVSDTPVSTAPAIPLTPSATPNVTRPPVADVRRPALMPTRLEKPPYPTISERLNEEGLTTVEVCTTSKGSVSSARLIESSGFNRLDDAAIKWVSGLRGIKPATLNGKPVPDCFSIPVEWKIEQR